MKYYVIPDLSELDKYLKLASDYNLGFEYNDFFDPNLLDNNEKLNDTISKYQSLKRKGDTLHGVFYDITLDSVDKKIKEVSLERVRSSLDIALKLNCKGVVFHTNYITWMKDKVYQDNWVKVHKELLLNLDECNWKKHYCQVISRHQEVSHSSNFCSRQMHYLLSSQHYLG